MPAEPSQPPPIPDQADYDDTPDLAYVPSLTGSGSTIGFSTEDSASVFSETPSQFTFDKSSYQPSLGSAKHSCPHSFTNIQTRDSHKDLTCERCKNKLDQSFLRCNYCAIRQCKSCQPGLQFDKIQEFDKGTNKNAHPSYLESVFFSKPKSREAVLQSVDALIEKIRAGKTSTELAEEPSRPTTQHVPPNEDKTNENSKDRLSSPLSALSSKSQTKAETTGTVYVAILMSGHDRQFLNAGDLNLLLGRDRKGQILAEEDIKSMAKSMPITPEALSQYFGPVLSGRSTGSSSSKQMPKSADSLRSHKDRESVLSRIPDRQSVKDSYDATTDEDCSSTSSSDESSITTRGIAGARKEEIIGEIILSITNWLRSGFLRLRMAAGRTTDGSCEGGSAPCGISEQSSQGYSQPTQKRKLGDRNDGQTEEEDGDDDDDAPHSGTDNKGKGREIQRFACPYFKYNPTKYQHWPICPGPGWLSVHRLKEHLYRKHRQAKFRCVRCWERFESEQDYFNHQRAPVPCELGEREPIEGFDADQEKQLKSRKKKSHLVSDIDKWRAVFQILFPHVPTDQIPSPFYEYEQLTSPASQAHETLTRCEEYVLRGLALQLREILVREFERDLQIIEQSLQQRAVESARAIVASLFQEFRTLQQQDRAPGTISGHGESQGHAGSSSSEAQPSRPDPMESHNIIFDAPEFDLDFLLGTDGSLSLFQGVLLEDIPQAPTDSGNNALKQSDSGYGSNNQEQPDE
ncbi:hypothetical protein O1611_g4333 [Lasiodiplodia mahajangana]|uniref:Uncharacterized protein n=1 Tax=Lasiodiplodia mahajangana TaxID=1108764 RepID=A0ACC2JPM5_9PEZI|nr:hypothetical protein O1611_g4333 [Lasiodiplodia mahajangana]